MNRASEEGIYQLLQLSKKFNLFMGYRRPSVSFSDHMPCLGDRVSKLCCTFKNFDIYSPPHSLKILNVSYPLRERKNLGPQKRDRNNKITMTVKCLCDKKVIFEKIDKNGKLPERQHQKDVGYDLFSAEDTTIKVGEVRAVKTGIRMKLPKGMEAQIRPRSGLSLSGVTVLNSPGTIDHGYRGEIKVIMANLLGDDVLIERGDRIAQMVFARVEHPELLLGSLDETKRGEGGFGSTGS